MIHIFLRVFLLWSLFISFTLKAVDFYWIGGTGNWSDITKWAATSGGLGGIGVPSINDNVIFDGNSFAPGDVITIDINAAVCNDMDWSGVTNIPTLNSSSALNSLSLYGSLTLHPSMNWNFNGTFYFLGLDADNTIDLQGNTPNHHINFDATGTYTLVNDFALASGKSFYFNIGTFNTNGFTFTVHNFESKPCPTNVRNLNLGASTLNITYWWWVNVDDLNLNAGTSTININNNNNGGQFMNWYCAPGAYTIAYNNVNFPATGGISSINTYYFSNTFKVDVSFNEVSFAANGQVQGMNTMNVLNLSPLATYEFKNGHIQTVGQINAIGNCNGFINIQSDLAGTQSFINSSSAAITMEYINLRDMAFGGGAVWTANNSNDNGNNTGITINLLTSRDLYWVGGTGDWDDPAHWSLSSGGPGGECPPSLVDNVFFDANSFPAGGTVSLNDLGAYCHNMDWTGVTNSPTFNTNNGSYIMYIYGSLTLEAPMNMDVTSPINFMANDAGNTIFTDGNAILGNVFFEGSGEWTLLDDFLVQNGKNISLNGGTLNSNDQTVASNNFYSKECPFAPRTLNMGASIFNINNWWWVNADGFTLNAGTSTINMLNPNAKLHNRYCGPGAYLLTYHDVNFVAATGTGELDSYFYSSSFMVEAHYNDVAFYSNNNVGGLHTYNTLTLSKGFTYKFKEGLQQTILTDLIAIGDCFATINMQSKTLGNQGLFYSDAAAITLEYVNLLDLDFSGACVWTANNAIDEGNVTGIILNAAVARTLYWVGGTGDWDDPAHWSLSSGGPGGECPPTSIDDVFFDENSFSNPGETVTVNVSSASCHDMTWLNQTLSPNFVSSSTGNELNIHGSLELDANMNHNFNGKMNFNASDTGNTITLNGVTLGHNVYFEGSGEWIMQDDFVMNAGKSIYFNNGNLNTNNVHVVVHSFYSNPCPSPTRSLTLGTSVIDVTYWWWVNADNFTIYPGTSTINISNNNNGGQMMNWYCSPGTYSIDYYNVNFTSTGGTSVLDAYYYNSSFQVTPNFNHVTFYGDGNINGNNTYNYLELTENSIYTLEAGSVQNILIDVIFNSYCGAPITLVSNLPGTEAFFYSDVAEISGINLIMQDVHGTGTTTWIAYESTDNGNNLNWNFLALPPVGEVGTVYDLGNTFWIDPVDGANAYTWTVSSGIDIEFGQGTDSIFVTYNGGPIDSICVVATNGCGINSSDMCFLPSIVLPVELIDFNGICLNNQKILTWSTASEMNAAYFILQSSSDGLFWEDVTEISAQGNNSTLFNYQYEIENNSHAYYRLQQVDYDGAHHAFDRVYIECKEGEDNELSIYPNPNNGNFTISASGWSEGVYQIEIYNGQSQVIWRNEQILTATQNEMEINLNKAAEGIYYLRVYNNEVNQMLKFQINY